MDIGEAVKAMKNGHSVARKGWNGRGMHLYLWQSPGSEMLPCVVMKTAQGTLQPGWLCSQADLLADDWEMAEP